MLISHPKKPRLSRVLVVVLRPRFVHHQQTEHDDTTILRQLNTRQPPTVLPGSTACSNPSSFTIASPTGAPVSSITSAKSPSFWPSGRLLVLASLWTRLTSVATKMPRRLNPSAISIGTMLQPLLLTTSAGHIGTNYPRTALIIVMASSASLVISFQELDLIRSFGASHEPPIAAMFGLAR